MPRSVRSLASASVLLCAAVGTGCKSAPQPPRVTDEMRAGFGQVAVVASGLPCRIGLEHGVAGTDAGMNSGFQRGAKALWEWPAAVLGAGARGASGGGGGVGMAVYGAVVLGAAAGAFGAALIYVPVSTVAGGLTAPAAEEADAAQEILVATAQDCGDGGRIADAVANGARLRLGRDLVARDAADTVVEIAVVEIEGGQTEGWLSYDKAFAIRTQVRATIVRRGTVLWDRVRSTRDDDFEAARRAPDAERTSAPRERSYVRWAGVDGAPLRAELESQFAAFAALLTDEIFGPPPGAEAASRAGR